MTPSPQVAFKTRRPKVWWSNAVFFVGAHIAALVGIYYRPVYAVPRATLVLAFVLWQLAEFGITIGYHRLWSHRAFRAKPGVRVVLAILGSSAFQGSIKRFTDDPVHDPYSATRGLLFSHVGWIFFKPVYEKMALVDKEDLENDPVVAWQHKYFVFLAIGLGLGFPTLLGALWGDAMGSFIWAGLTARIFVWHCTFFVNSLAHWDGLQPYSDENTSRGNFLLAVLTAGEGNHNFHAFPHDFRSGPSWLDWDPSKWIILALHRLGLVYSLRTARGDDIEDARQYMHEKSRGDRHRPHDEEEEWSGAVWTKEKAEEYVAENPQRCVLLIEGFLVDATAYLKEHPGGARLLREYSLRRGTEPERLSWRDASWAFDGGLNNHSRAAKKRLREFRVARLVSEDAVVE
ncbi:hypothetical protein GLOTRDRAFT_135138 [Gloeophyllum trabeum ATCC 11539]|uniref:Acyl-CoA desaturase n=1 Tax=Gloeophyllum trabeum (strain ATCC 11539 / FP-39264 / Madison 617) TaxID=670483 RepID=S7S3R4_GLOTA|nr:uncharacterized protein GLOTRDRAFT_135138 [Gloeophyllum trabeum ATCC 11539]EPQ60464.1 hypothetical protein GLOTRDRAFT_135138 [Gloeophyllum trabeum ATCC 11539]